MMKRWLVALGAAAMFACAPATAQKISDLPAATTLSGTEKVPAIQGSGCATHVAPCSNVALTVAQLATLAGSASQPLDADLTSLAAQTTGANKCQFWSGSATAALFDCTSFTRGLGASADAAGFRSAIGLGSLSTQSGTFSGSSSGTNTGDQTRASLGAAAAGANSDITSLTGLTTPLPISEGGTGATSAAAARTTLQVARETVFVAGSGGSVTGTTTETVLATITIPAGAIGANGTVEVVALWSEPNSANTKTLRIAFGGTTIYQQVATTVVATQGYARISNRNSQTAQIAPLGSSAGLGNFATMVTTAIDTTATVNVTITGQLTNTGETIGLESYLVRVTYGA